MNKNTYIIIQNIYAILRGKGLKQRLDSGIKSYV